MDELEQSQQELKDDVYNIKEQLAKVLELLKEREAEGNPSGASQGQKDTISHMPDFTRLTQSYCLNSQGMPMPLNMHSNNDTPAAIVNQRNPTPPKSNHTAQETSQTQPTLPIFIPYPFPPNYIPPLNTNLETNPVVVTSMSDPQNTTLSQIIHGNLSIPRANPASIANPEPQNHQMGDLQHKGKLQILEERLRVIEGRSHYVLADAADLCLVPYIVIPPKFKVPDFDKYKGTTCPKNHLTMYCRKMAAFAHDDKILIHFFQDSLTGAATSWYTHLKRARIRSWKDLADAFLKQYKYNIDMAPDRLQLQNMVKRDSETFKEYAQRWREVAAQVKPPLSEKEMVTMFIDTLQSPFYDRMIGSISSNFSDIVAIGGRIEGGMRSGKIALGSTGFVNSKKSSPEAGKEKEGEAHAVVFEQGKSSHGRPNCVPIHYQQPFHSPYTPYPYTSTTSLTPHSQPYYPPMTYRPPPSPAQPPIPTTTVPSSNQRKPNYKGKRSTKLDPIPMSYTELLPHLIRGSLITPRPLPLVEPPYPKGYDPNARCDYHAGAAGHSTENCTALKYKVQNMINDKQLSFEANNPCFFPGQENSGIGTKQ